jgi:hypothetical protein
LKAPIRPGSLCQAMYELTKWNILTKIRSNRVGLKFGKSMVLLGLEVVEPIVAVELGAAVVASADGEGRLDQLLKCERRGILFGPGSS